MAFNEQYLVNPKEVRTFFDQEPYKNILLAATLDVELEHNPLYLTVFGQDIAIVQNGADVMVKTRKTFKMELQFLQNLSNVRAQAGPQRVQLAPQRVQSVQHRSNALVISRVEMVKENTDNKQKKETDSVIREKKNKGYGRGNPLDWFNTLAIKMNNKMVTHF